MHFESCFVPYNWAIGFALSFKYQFISISIEPLHLRWEWGWDE